MLAAEVFGESWSFGETSVAVRRGYRLASPADTARGWNAAGVGGAPPRVWNDTRAIIHRASDTLARHACPGGTERVVAGIRRIPTGLATPRIKVGHALLRLRIAEEPQRTIARWAVLRGRRACSADLRPRLLACPRCPRAAGGHARESGSAGLPGAAGRARERVGHALLVVAGAREGGTARGELGARIPHLRHRRARPTRAARHDRAEPGLALARERTRRAAAERPCHLGACSGDVVVIEVIRAAPLRIRLCAGLRLVGCGSGRRRAQGVRAARPEPRLARRLIAIRGLERGGGTRRELRTSRRRAVRASLIHARPRAGEEHTTRDGDDRRRCSKQPEDGLHISTVTRPHHSSFALTSNGVPRLERDHDRLVADGPRGLHPVRIRTAARPHGGDAPRRQVPRRARPRRGRDGRRRRGDAPRARPARRAQVLLRERDEAEPRARSTASCARRALRPRMRSEHVARVLDVGRLDDGRALHRDGAPRGRGPARRLLERRRATAHRGRPSTTSSRRARRSPRRTRSASCTATSSRRTSSSRARPTARPASRCSTSASRRSTAHPGAPTSITTQRMLGSPLYMSPEQLRSPARRRRAHRHLVARRRPVRARSRDGRLSTEKGWWGSRRPS